MTKQVKGPSQYVGIIAISLIYVFSNSAESSIASLHTPLDAFSKKKGNPNASIIKPAKPKKNDVVLFYPNVEHPFVIDICGKKTIMKIHPENKKISTKLCRKTNTKITNKKSFLKLATEAASSIAADLFYSNLPDVVQRHNMKAQVTQAWLEVGCARVTLIADEPAVKVDPFSEMRADDSYAKHPAKGELEMFICVQPARQFKRNLDSESDVKKPIRIFFDSMQLGYLALKPRVSPKADSHVTTLKTG